MARPKKKLLPNYFKELLEKGDIVALKAVFETCDVNAYDGYSRETALAFDNCPDELTRWLISKGADLSATDRWDRTPLHNRASSRSGNIEVLLELGADVNRFSTSVGTPLHSAASFHLTRNARLLLAQGAEVNATNREGLTPLELALQRCSNIQLEQMVQLAECLLAAGADKTQKARSFVEEIGKRFEFHRSSFNPDSVDVASAALDRLYQLFDVPPVPRRSMHDGRSPITVKAKTWPDQHQELWNLLVPSSGAAATVQGEVIRIAGRISQELENNGGINWDADFTQMADAFLVYLATGNALSSSDLAEATRIIAEVKRKTGNTRRLAELAVAWVLVNAKPIGLAPPAYRR